MSKTKTPITRREILIGGAAAVAVAGCPFWLLPISPNLQALLRRKNNFEEKLT
jgi:hypothetical protein